MIASAMPGDRFARRSPARYLAPIALAATIGASYLIVHHALNAGTARSARPSATVPVSLRPRGRYSRHAFYRVKPGDTLSAIAAKTGVPLATLEQLNPKLNPNALQVGQRLRLRR
jgi:Tfp pilus assembly protein FimV